VEGVDAPGDYTLAEACKLVRHLGHRVSPLQNSGCPRTRCRKVVNFHPAGGSEQWVVHNNSHCNVERALVERVLTVKLDGVRAAPPQPAVGHIKIVLRDFRKKLLHYVGRIPSMSTEEFVDTYTGAKRKKYAATVGQLDINPLRRQDAYISPFIKDEKTNLSRKENPCPRMIQPRSMRFNVAIGIHLKPMEKPIFRAIARIFGSTTVMKGLNAQQRGQCAHSKWSRFIKPVAVMLDASRFDQHCSRQVIDWEHGVEEAIAGDRVELRRLNRMRRMNKCFVRTECGGFKYTLNGVRMSGDMDTAMANCLTMCAMTYAFMTDLRIQKYEYMNDGDDGVLFLEQHDLDLVLNSFMSWFHLCGYTMKLEGVAYELEQVEFCQARPIYDGVGWKFVRDPYICLGKDSISLRNDISREGMIDLRNSVGWCGASLAGDMPIFCEYYRSMISGSRPEETYETGMQFLAKGMTPIFKTPTTEARLSFWKAYGIFPDLQIAIEELIRNSDYQINSPAVQVMNFNNHLQHMLSSRFS